MSTLLVINAGSSSLKFAVWERRRLVLRGLVDRLGPQAVLSITRGRRQRTRRVQAKTVSQAMAVLRQELRREKSSPTTVAHRIVHGGWVFDRPTVLTSAVLTQLQKFTALAPLHMPANLTAVRLSRTYWPAAKQIGVFDTAIYRHLRPAVRLYALPLALSHRYHLQKYGFHGISHDWALRQAARQLKKTPRQLEAVTLHLGSGDSMTWWRRGRAEDTSMGFTPLEGLAMATRSGDIDPAIPLFLLRQGYSPERVDDLLQHRSGLFGLTGLTDMRDILSAAGHPIAGWPRRRWSAVQRQHARLAIDMFVYDIQRYLGGYLSQMSRSAVIIFTGAIGQNSYLRRRILAFPGGRGHRVIVVPADEESAIATAVQRMVR